MRECGFNGMARTKLRLVPRQTPKYSVQRNRFIIKINNSNYIRISRTRTERIRRLLPAQSPAIYRNRPKLLQRRRRPRTVVARSRASSSSRVCRAPPPGSGHPPDDRTLAERKPSQGRKFNHLLYRTGLRLAPRTTNPQCKSRARTCKCDPLICWPQGTLAQRHHLALPRHASPMAGAAHRRASNP